MRNRVRVDLRQEIDELYAKTAGKGSSCGEKVAFVTDADASCDVLFPGNTCSNLTVVYRGPTTGGHLLTLPASPFVGERVTVVSDGNLNRFTQSLNVGLNGGSNDVSMTGVPPTNPVVALTIPSMTIIGGAAGFSSVTVLWDGDWWVQVAEVPSLPKTGPPP